MPIEKYAHFCVSGGNRVTILLLWVPWTAPSVPFRTEVWKRFYPQNPIIDAIPIDLLGELCALLVGELISCTLFFVSS